MSFIEKLLPEENITSAWNMYDIEDILIWKERTSHLSWDLGLAG